MYDSLQYNPNVQVHQGSPLQMTQLTGRQYLMVKSMLHKKIS